MASSSPLSSSRFAGETLPLAPGAIAALRSVKGILLSAPSLAYKSPLQELFEGKLVDALGWAFPGAPGDAPLNLDEALGGSNAPYPRNTLKAWANAASESLAFPAGYARAATKAIRDVRGQTRDDLGKTPFSGITLCRRFRIRVDRALRLHP